MKKLAQVLFLIGISMAPVFAKEAGNAGLLSASALAAALAVGIAACGCGVGMGLCIASALQGIARQPELMPKLQMNMMIGLALIESLVLYALFIAIILLYANPFLKLIE